MNTKFEFADGHGDMALPILENVIGDGPELLVTFNWLHTSPLITRASIRGHFVQLDGTNNRGDDHAVFNLDRGLGTYAVYGNDILSIVILSHNGDSDE